MISYQNQGFYCYDSMYFSFDGFRLSFVKARGILCIVVDPYQFGGVFRYGRFPNPVSIAPRNRQMTPTPIGFGNTGLSVLGLLVKVLVIGFIGIGPKIRHHSASTSNFML